MEFLVKPAVFDKDKLTITFEILLHDSSSLIKLEKLFDKQILQKMILQNLRKQTEEKISWSQHKKIYALIRTILKHQVNKYPELNLIINETIVNNFYQQIKKQYFPLRIENFGDFVIPYIPSITEIEKDEAIEVINRIIEDYTELGVNFEEWKSEWIFPTGQTE